MGRRGSARTRGAVYDGARAMILRLSIALGVSKKAGLSSVVIYCIRFAA